MVHFFIKITFFLTQHYMIYPVNDYDDDTKTHVSITVFEYTLLND